MTKLLLRLCVATAALATVSTAVIAADYSPPPPPDELRPTIWSGFYIGGNLGYAFGGSDDVSITSNVEGTVDNIDDLELNGIFGGGQIGYDVQWDSIVFGAVADIEAADINDDFTKNFTISGNDDQLKAKGDIDVWGTLRARLGVAFDNVLIYGTGGLAWANVDYDMRANNFTTGGTGRIKDNSTRVGYAVGGGVEWAIDDSWSLGAEYLYVNLGDYKIKGDADDGAGNHEIISTKAEPDFHSVKGYVNFRF
jgi:outer membrane immunogenic protein